MTINVKMDIKEAKTIRECDSQWATDMGQLYVAESKHQFIDTMMNVTRLVAQLKNINCGKNVELIIKDTSSMFGVSFKFHNGTRVICETPILENDSQLTHQFLILLGKKLGENEFDPKWKEIGEEMTNGMVY